MYCLNKNYETEYENLLRKKKALTCEHLEASDDPHKAAAVREKLRVLYEEIGLFAVRALTRKS